MNLLNKLRSYIEKLRQAQQERQAQKEHKQYIGSLFASSINATMLKKY